ncbi:MAG TPA: PKD domain-containing protein, partial [Nitrospirota bacterium]|nr:PKD domain-containing protein [Nitrospirota bacterium]
MELQSIKKSLLVISVCICLFLAMTGCSADDGGFLKQQSQLPTMGPYPGTGNSVPLANAGADQYVHVGTIVTLNGNSSYDPDGNALTYSWHIDVQPAGSSASLSDASSVNPTFRVDRGGVYRISLVVSDGSQNSLPDSMNITTVNQTPVAHAGPDQSASIGNLVALDGSSSSDPDGDTLTYYWQLESPHASAAVLSDSHAVKPTFVPDVAGIYDCYLFVSDGTDSSSMDSVRVSVSLTAVADAGPDQYHTSGPSTLITLDGSGSYDSAGRSMTYSWSFLRKPDGSTATLSNVAVVSPTFTADLEGKYELSLQIMHDGYVNSQPDTVIVIVIANRPLNILPFNVNDAEYDKSMDRIIIVSSSPSNQLHIYDPAANQDQTIDLDAPPTSISVSPDGLYAAIGHNGFISYADLVSRSVVTTLQVNGTIADIVLGGNEYVYAFFQQNPFIAVNISTGVTATVSQRWDVKGKLHPSGAALYTLNA